MFCNNPYVSCTQLHVTLGGGFHYLTTIPSSKQHTDLQNLDLYSIAILYRCIGVDSRCILILKSEIVGLVVFFIKYTSVFL